MEMAQMNVKWVIFISTWLQMQSKLKEIEID